MFIDQWILSNNACRIETCYAVTQSELMLLKIWQWPWRYMYIISDFFISNFENRKMYSELSFLVIDSLQADNKEDIEKFSKRTVKVSSLLVLPSYYLHP